MTEQLLDPIQTTNFLALRTPRTLELWRWKRTGPPYILVGRRVRYRRSDLEAWLAKRRVDVDANGVNEMQRTT
jgi:predicted DNA-binding transcriptional regulator AlpA